MIRMNLWVLIILYALCSSTGLILIKNGFNVQMSGVDSIWQLERLLGLLMGGRFLAGFILYLSGFLIWLYILSSNDLSLVFPIASGVLYVGLLMGSVLWLHEGVGLVRITGVFLILAGIILVSRS